MKAGYAFSEHIRTEKVKRRHYEIERSFRMRDYLLPVVLVVSVLILIGRLFSLQIVQGNYYRQLADSNRIRTRIIHASRGVIFDRNGNPLVYNIPGFRETVNGKSIHLTREQALALLAKGDQHVEIDSLREYPYKDALAHVIGYLGQISPDELKDAAFYSYQPTDWVGKSGIEEQYEHSLRGTDGKELIEVDALGRQVQSLGQTDPIPGQDITLTIDAKLQQQVYAAMSSVVHGAAIVSKPDGEILAMISKPSFDPNLFTLDQNYQPSSTSAYRSVQAILSDSQNQPLLNRAISGVYPPGSTFKLIVAAAGLEDHIIDEQYTITDPGILKVGTFSFANWYYTDYGLKEQGPINVVRAITRSNDIFFYKLAAKVGIDKISQEARKFGLGALLGIDLPGEQAGLVPTVEWKQKTLGQPWYLGDTYNYGIGQGYLLTTPLQVNTWTQAIANNGTIYQPHLLKTQEAKIMKQGLLSEKTVALLRQGMVGACSTGGVGWPLFNFQFQIANFTYPIDGKNFFIPANATNSAQKKNQKDIGVSIACKTGTAQYGGAQTLPHAWITLFAPAYNPQVVVTVLSESSGEGSNIAGPIAKDILTDYFEE